jgi:branched-chain amino acid transport system substrate-binding protein
MSTGVSFSRRAVTRRGFLTVAVSAIVAGVVAGVGAYYAGTLSAPVKEVVKEVTKTVTTTTTLAPGAPVTSTVTVTAPPTTVTKTVTSTVTVTAPTKPLLEGQEIRVGVVLPLSGALSTFGQQGRRGVELAAEEINGANGILGAKIKLFVEDFAGDPKVALTATEKLITVDKVHIVTGAYMSAAIAVMQEPCERYKVPLLAIGGAADELTAKGYKYFFRNVQSASEFTQATMEFVNEVIKPKTVGIVYEKTLRGESTKNAFLKLAEQYKFTVAAEEGYPVGSLDFKPLIEKLKAANPDVLLFVAYITDAVLLAKQMDEVGYKPKAVVVEAGMQNIDLLELAGRYVKGWFIQTQYWPDRNYPDYNEVYKVGLKFWQRFGKPLDNIACDGYLNLYILKDAIERAKSLDTEAIRNAIAETDLHIPWFGHIKYGPNGHRINALETFAMCQILPAKPNTPWQANGLSFYAVWPEKMKTTEPIYPMPT